MHDIVDCKRCLIDIVSMSLTSINNEFYSTSALRIFDEMVGNCIQIEVAVCVIISTICHYTTENRFAIPFYCTLFSLDAGNSDLIYVEENLMPAYRTKQKMISKS